MNLQESGRKTSRKREERERREREEGRGGGEEKRGKGEREEKRRKGEERERGEEEEEKVRKERERKKRTGEREEGEERRRGRERRFQGGVRREARRVSEGAGCEGFRKLGGEARSRCRLVPGHQFKLYRGKLVVRNYKGGDGNVGMNRSPIRAEALGVRGAASAEPRPVQRAPQKHEAAGSEDTAACTVGVTKADG